MTGETDHRELQKRRENAADEFLERCTQQWADEPTVDKMIANADI